MVLAPSREAFIDAVPIAILGREQAPLRATAGDPEDGLKKTATLGLLADINGWEGAKKRQDLLPLFIG